MRDFYTEVVGLSLGERPPFESFGYWLYAGREAVLHLTEVADEASARIAPSTFGHGAFNCIGRREFERRLALRGITFEVAHVPLTEQIQLFFKDPAGNGVELNFAATET